MLVVASLRQWLQEPSRRRRFHAARLRWPLVGRLEGQHAAAGYLSTLAIALEAGVPLARILMSSDGNGAPPKEEKGENKPRVANYMPVGALHAAWRRIVQEEGAAPEDALRVVTSNVARATGLASKGEIAPGKDADLLVLNEDWSIHSVFARGKVFVQDGAPLIRGMFDEILLRELG